MKSKYSFILDSSSLVYYTAMHCLYFLLRKRYEGLFRKNMQIIEENECMIKRYVYELDVLKQRAGEMAETNREKTAKLNQKICYWRVRIKNK